MQEQHDWMDVERRSGTYDFGRREGRAEGRQEGRQEGLQEGARIALRELIFSCLADRQLVVDEATATQIHSCEDLETLQRVARRAMSASSLRELFE